MQQTEMFEHDYEVFIADWNGHRVVKCDDIDQVWQAIGRRAFGGLYEVRSPTGKDCRQFIPY